MMVVIRVNLLISDAILYNFSMSTVVYKANKRRFRHFDMLLMCLISISREVHAVRCRAPSYKGTQSQHRNAAAPPRPRIGGRGTSLTQYPRSRAVAQKPVVETVVFGE